jgi:hypothetical protein
MLPRLQLSVTVCNNFYIKIAAARQKENLLERMDVDQFRTALLGGTNSKSGALSQSDMDLIAMSLEFGEERHKYKYSLEDLVEEELQNMHKNDEIAVRQYSMMTGHTNRPPNSLTVNLNLTGSLNTSSRTNALRDSKSGGNNNRKLLSMSLDRGLSDSGFGSGSTGNAKSELVDENDLKMRRSKKVLAVNPAHFSQTGKKIYKNYIGSVDLNNMKRPTLVKPLQLMDVQQGDALELSSLPPSARSRASFSFSPGKL